MNKILSVICLLVLSMGVRAQSSEALQRRFAEELAQKSVRIESIVCRFDQTRVMSILANEVTKSGEFTYLRPEMIRLAFDDGDYIIMTESHFRMRSGGKQSDVKINSNPQLKELKRLLSACMSGDVSQITAGFKSELQQTSTHYTMLLTPLKARQGRVARIHLKFNREDMSLEELRMEEQSGDYTHYSFEGKRFNTAVDKSQFNQ